jgi:hypothetical protein
VPRGAHDHRREIRDAIAKIMHEPDNHATTEV